jgi:hypothetical protein
MIYSGKENVPLLMSLRRDNPAAGKSLIEQFNAGHPRNGKLAPVRETTAAAFPCDLICKEVHHLFLNAIVMRLRDTQLVLIQETQQPPLMNGAQDELMNGRVHGCGRRMPYYMK